MASAEKGSTLKSSKSHEALKIFSVSRHWQPLPTISRMGASVFCTNRNQVPSAAAT